MLRRKKKILLMSLNRWMKPSEKLRRVILEELKMFQEILKQEVLKKSKKNREVRQEMMLGSKNMKLKKSRPHG
jgi:TRAP-type C4-dicarboxylate transport system substrate-binding protein